MDLKNIIYQRRSTRNFLKKPIDKEKIKQIIEAGNQAPSACNLQEWRFKILNDFEKQQIVKFGGADFIEYAPLAIIVTYIKSDNPYKDSIQSASACIQNMILMATSLGIGSCWVCHLPPKWRLNNLLNIPSYYDPIACVVFGYPKYTPKKVERKYKYQDLFKFKTKNKRNILKYLYTRQPIRLKIIEKKFTKRFQN